MTTALFLLRAIQVGLTLDDLEELEAGMVADIITESANDDCEYRTFADQDDFDKW